MSRSKVTNTITLELSELNAPWIYKAGLYKLILKSKAKHAEVFQDWLCSEVPPQIRKTGSYMPHEEAVNKIRNPTRETKLHYKVEEYIARSAEIPKRINFSRSMRKPNNRVSKDGC